MQTTTRNQIREMSKMLLGCRPYYSVLRKNRKVVGIKFVWMTVHQGRFDALSLLAFSDWLEERDLRLVKSGSDIWEVDLIEE